jgi:hypothetical protein
MQTAIAARRRNWCHILQAEWTPFQTHYFSENLEALGIESGTLDL